MYVCMCIYIYMYGAPDMHPKPQPLVVNPSLEALVARPGSSRQAKSKTTPLGLFLVFIVYCL